MLHLLQDAPLDMVTTADSKIWDDLSETGVQTLEGHQSNVSSAMYRSTLLIVDVGSQGGIVYITAWVHSNATVVLLSSTQLEEQGVWMPSGKAS